MKKYFLIFLIALTPLFGLATVNAQTGASLNERQKKKIIKKVLSSNSFQIYSDNSQGSPLYVQEANVKEIAADEFAILAGETPKHIRQSTFPEATVFNSSGKTIKAFAIAVKSVFDKPKSAYIMLKSDLSILSNTTYKVVSTEWVKAERISIQKGDKFVNALRKPGLDSAKSWIPGAASDLKITIGFVEFTDGTTWIISQDSDW